MLLPSLKMSREAQEALGSRSTPQAGGCVSYRVQGAGTQPAGRGRCSHGARRHGLAWAEPDHLGEEKSGFFIRTELGT